MVPNPPCPLDDGHWLDGFECSQAELARWLVRRARKNQAAGASRCFVVCGDDQNVVGYYALAAGAVSQARAPGAIRRNLPEPIPVAVLARLAVHSRWAGKGIGRGLFKDAVLRTLQASRELGIRALLCHAIDEKARSFYLKHGFVESPIDPMTLMLGLPRLRDELFLTAE